MKTNITTFLLVVVLLLGYWWIVYATYNQDFAGRNYERFMWAIMSNVIGIFLMIGSDVQKFTQLKLKKGLISDGFFERTRNPNYLGEIMIYASFGIIAQDCVSWCILVTIWLVLFTSSMLMKESSFMKKDGWNKYKDQSLLLLPRLTKNYWLNYVIYGIIAFVGR